MKIRSIQTALTPCNVYVCLACRIRFLPTTLQPRRQQHAATESSNPQSDTIPVHFSKPFTQSSAKENSDVSDLNADGKSNDAISSVPSGHKVGREPHSALLCYVTAAHSWLLSSIQYSRSPGNQARKLRNYNCNSTRNLWRNDAKMRLLYSCPMGTRVKAGHCRVQSWRRRRRRRRS